MDQVLCRLFGGRGGLNPFVHYLFFAFRHMHCKSNVELITFPDALGCTSANFQFLIY